MTVQPRRDFLKQAAAAGLGLAGAGALAAEGPADAAAGAAPPRRGQSVAGLAAARLDVVRIGIVGVGGRGTSDLQELLLCEGVQIKAICDIVEGRSIVVQHDTSNPRPYSRINLIMGTKGIFRGYSARICIGGRTHGDEWESLDGYKDMAYPLWTKLAANAVAAGGHGGMDFVLNWRLIYCLRYGLPLDIDVYDTATWSAVSALSEASVAGRGASVEFPDFTRGGWKTAKPLEIVS